MDTYKFHPFAVVTAVGFSVFSLTFFRAIIDVESMLSENHANNEAIADCLRRHAMKIASNGDLPGLSTGVEKIVDNSPNLLPSK